MIVYRHAFAVAVLAAMATSSASAEPDRCVECGASGPCRKVCRLVCENSKVDVVCYGYTCEDFCIPGPSLPECEHCDTICAQCDAEGNRDPNAPHALTKHFSWTSWFSASPKLYTRKKLMKKTVSKTIPTYKWVVEEVCSQCQSGLASVEVATDVGGPPARVADALPLAPMNQSR